jgi:Ser/Thr protein kinase RdoA (MazF antagonist)
MTLPSPGGVPAALSAWSGVEVVRPLTGGHRNQVLLARRGTDQLVVRRCPRPAEAVRWEIELLAHLGARGFTVPAVVPADDGRPVVDGVVVSRFITGRPPRDAADWRRVVAVVRDLHAATTDWPQRPGFASSGRLLGTGAGGDVRLDAMPAAVRETVRAAWSAVQIGPSSVVHGDVGAGNVLVDGDRVALLDWDEARVDVAWFDLAFVPAEVPVEAPVPRHLLVEAGLAWEAATCWQIEPWYARRRLAELRVRLRTAQR